MADPQTLEAVRAQARALANNPAPKDPLDGGAVFGVYPKPSSAHSTNVNDAALRRGVQATGPSTFVPAAPLLAGGIGGGAGRGFINPANAAPAAVPMSLSDNPVAQVRKADGMPAPAAAAAASAAAPLQLGTTGNIVINGTDASGKANSFSGTNVGYNASYVNPDGSQAVMKGPKGETTGIGPEAGKAPPMGLVQPGGAPTPAQQVANAGTAPGAPAGGPQASTVAANTGTQNAGMPNPVAAPAVTSPAPQSSSFAFGLSPQEQASQGAFAQAGRTVDAPSTVDAQQRANRLQDAQLGLAQQAIALASSGNLSDAIMAKHIRSTIAALSGAGQTHSSAVNPLLNTQQGAATSERNTDVQASSARYSANLGASTAVRSQNIEAYYKLPLAQQQATMAQLQAKAAQGDQNALQMIRDLTAAQDKGQTPILDLTGATRGIFAQGMTNVVPTFSTEPGAPPIGADAARARLQNTRGMPAPGG